MTEIDPLLDRAAMRDAFRRLGERLVRRGVVAEEVSRVFPDEPVSGRARMILEDLFSEQ